MVGSVETRQRRAFLDATVQEIGENLTQPAMKGFLEEEYIESSLAMLGLLYVPNIKNGHASAPRRYRGSRHIPVIPLLRNEKMSVDASFSEFSPVQRDLVYKKLTAWLGDGSEEELVRHFETILRQDVDLMPDLPDYSATRNGFVTSAMLNFTFRDHDPALMGKSPVKVLRGRPIVGLVNRVPPHAGTTLMHELQHVNQRLRQPFANPSKVRQERYSDELEAYKVGACYSLGVDAIGRYAAGFAIEKWQVRVEHLRQQHARPGEPFYANAQLRSALDEAGLDRF